MNKVEINFANPKLDSTSSTSDVLFALKQFVEIEKEITKLNDINLANYTEFIKEHRNIIKKNMPIVGKTYRFINKDCSRINNSYYLGNISHKIEFFYVNYAKLQSVPDYRGLIPSVKCIPLDINGNPFSDERAGFLFVDDPHSKGEDIYIDRLSEEDYPEITKVFKKIISKKTDKDLMEYERLKRKFG